MEPSVFISYRRADEPGLSRAIYEGLKAELGEEHVFFDVGDIEAGTDWQQEITQALENSVMLLVLIGPKWLNVKNEQGRRKLDAPKDTVRFEIATALRRAIPIVPVLLESSKLPSETELPRSLKGILRVQAYEVRESSFDRDLEGLNEIIRGSLKTSSGFRVDWRVGSAIAAISIAAISGVFLAPRFLFSPDISTTDPADGVGRNGAHPTPSCVEIDVQAAKKLPYYLINSIGSEDFPYWFRLEATNNCESDVHLVATFTRQKGPIMIGSTPPWEHTVKAGSKYAANLEPDFELTDPRTLLDDDVKLGVKVVISDRDERRLGSVTKDISMLQANKLVWELEGHDGGRVSEDYLAASLSAWSKVRKKPVEQWAKDCRGAGLERDPDRWLPQCYEAAASLANDRAIPPLWERKDEHSIRSADQVFNRGGGNSLEVALAVAALGRSYSEDSLTHLGLVMYREHADQGPGLLFLWRRGESDWQAFDARRFDQPFQDNKRAASLLVRELAILHDRLLESLDSDGVYLADSSDVLALEFGKAAKNFEIGGLP